MTTNSMTNTNMLPILSRAVYLSLLILVFMLGIRLGYNERSMAKRYGDPNEFKIREMNGKLFIQMPDGSGLPNFNNETNEDSLKKLIRLVTEKNISGGAAERPNKLVRFIAEF